MSKSKTKSPLPGYNIEITKKSSKSPKLSSSTGKKLRDAMNKEKKPELIKIAEKLKIKLTKKPTPKDNNNMKETKGVIITKIIEKTNKNEIEELKERFLQKGLKCGRALNGKNEDQMLTDLVNRLSKNKTDPILIEFKKVSKIHNEIVRIEKVGGRGKHYDLVFILDDGRRVQIEVKATKCDKLNKSSTPWSEGVQVINGPGQFFSITRMYAKMWYKKNIKSGIVNKTFGLKHNIPEYDVWSKNLAFKQAKANDWGLELYGKSKQGNVDFNKMKKLKVEFTRYMSDLIEKDDKVLKETIPEAQQMLQKTFSQKHAWLRIAGDVNKNPEFKWAYGVIIPNLKDIKLNKFRKTGKLSEDLYVDLIFDNFKNMQGLSRWGYGNGVSNIRFDFKDGFQDE
jgi:hypothetical protein